MFMLLGPWICVCVCAVLWSVLHCWINVLVYLLFGAINTFELCVGMIMCLYDVAVVSHNI
jgi:hypothetical protein